MTDEARRVWREGFAPLLDDAQLVALYEGLESDDPRILQGAITAPADDLDLPPPLFSPECRAACPVAYAGWTVEGLGTTAAVEAWFADLAARAFRRLNDMLVSPLFGWIDQTPRAEMRTKLMAEVARTLKERGISCES